MFSDVILINTYYIYIHNTDLNKIIDEIKSFLSIVRNTELEGFEPIQTKQINTINTALFQGHRILY